MTFPQSMAFRKTWRSYQARVLEHLDSFRDDNRVHVIAAPGSGKTVLGLEILRRLNEPTLVLTPTITIRDQWFDRLVEQFLPVSECHPEWVSTKIKEPAALTIATYQALHSICAGSVGEEQNQFNQQEENEGPEAEANHREFKIQFPDELRQIKFKTVVVDEAHHLRAEWWKTLKFVVEQLDKPTIVALTATPPYDVSPFEWQRYEELCGPADAEVSVPELVLSNDLCPHQDYVYFSVPSAKEQRTLQQFREAVDSFTQRLRLNREFRAVVQTHPWLRSPNSHVEEILDNPECFSSMIVFLSAVGEEIPEEVLSTLGLTRQRIPPLTLEWLEILLSHCLYEERERSAESEAVLKTLRRELLEMGAVEHRKIKLRDRANQMKLLTSSVTKLKSIQEIVALESGGQGSALRCVVLTDFIRKQELPNSAGEIAVFEDIGVAPIFETLRQADLGNMRLGVLSGSLVIIPGVAEKILREAAAALEVRSADLSVTALAHDSRYSKVEIRGEYHQGAVRLMTYVFEKGGITVLVGTKSLLGEGWDAPCINTLVLASFVGSYVLSNQMRGRSIRIDSNQPDKTANIWHLVCVEPGPFGPGADYELLARRCGAFVGVSASRAVIESGAQRLGCGQPPFSREQITQSNSKTYSSALDRAALKARWQGELLSGNELVHGVEADQQTGLRGFVLRNTIASLVLEAWFIFLALLYVMMRSGGHFVRNNSLANLALVVGIPVLISMPWALLAAWRFIRHGTPERSMREVGRVVLDSLQYEGSISRADQIRVHANRNEDGTIFCWVAGGNSRDQSEFLRALREVLRPIENPRYFLARKGLWRRLGEDYFAIPEVLGRKKEFAEFFARRWGKLVGPVQLVYSRTPEGRRMLLRARMHSLAAAFQKRSEHVSCWK